MIEYINNGKRIDSNDMIVYIMTHRLFLNENMDELVDQSKTVARLVTGRHKRTTIHIIHQTIMHKLIDRIVRVGEDGVINDEMARYIRLMVYGILNMPEFMEVDQSFDYENESLGATNFEQTMMHKLKKKIGRALKPREWVSIFGRNVDGRI